MSFTSDLKLPTYEELECPVVNVSAAALRAGSFHLAKYCDLQFKVRSIDLRIRLQSPDSSSSSSRNSCYADRFVAHSQKRM